MRIDKSSIIKLWSYSKSSYCGFRAGTIRTLAWSNKGLTAVIFRRCLVPIPGVPAGPTRSNCTYLQDLVSLESLVSLCLGHQLVLLDRVHLLILLYQCHLDHPVYPLVLEMLYEIIVSLSYMFVLQSIHHKKRCKFGKYCKNLYTGNPYTRQKPRISL